MNCAARSDEWGYAGYRRPYGFWHPGWIVLMVLGFLLWWPVGLAILAFTLWSRRMSCWGGHGYDHWQEKMERMRSKIERFGPGGGWHGPSSGNRAFDEYRSETLQRLEEEQREFREFLQRLRMAKDKSEFDQFMTERRNRPAPPPQS
jgi:hypothetical protein